MDHQDATNNITTPGVVGAWLKEEKLKQENSVIGKDKSSREEKEMMPDRNEQYPLPRDANNHSPGPNDVHHVCPHHV